MRWQNPWEKIAALLNKRTQGTPRFALEKQALSLARFDQLKTYFPASDFSHDVTPLIEKLQLIKQNLKFNVY